MSSEKSSGGGSLAAKVLIGSLVAAVLAGVAWYFGPWSAPWRYERSDLVSLKRVADANPKDQLAWRTIGLRLARDGDALAESSLSEAFKLNPADPEVGTGLGELLLSQGRIPEAFQVLKSSVEHNPKYALARMALGRLYQRRGSYGHAAEQYEAITTSDSKYSDAWFELATCYLQLQQAAKALAAIDHCLALYPDEPHYLALKGSVCAAVGQVREGIDLAKRAADLAPKDIKINTNLITMLLVNHQSSQDLDDADRLVKRLSELQPDLPILPYHRGEVARLRGNWTEAIPNLELAARSPGAPEEASFALSQAYRKAGRVADAELALKLYRRVQEMRRRMDKVRIDLGSDPSNTKLLMQLYTLQRDSGDYNSAVSTLKTILQVEPSHSGAAAALREYSRTGLQPPSRSVKP